MAQIHKVRLPDGRTVRPTEWSSTPLYSTVEIAEGALTPLQGFSYGVGGEVPGSVGPRRSNARDTNMNGEGGVLQENEELLLHSIMVEFFAAPSVAADFIANADAGQPTPPEVSARNIARIQRDTRLVLRIANTKEYAAHPVGFFPAGMGTEITNGAARLVAADSPILSGSNGGVNSYDNREFATPHHVGPGEAFEITLDFPFGSVTGLDMGDDSTDGRIRARIYADGYRRRPVA
jgi:hypothetical protein